MGGEKTLVPSAQILMELHDSKEPFADYGLARAQDYRAYFSGLAAELNGHYSLFMQEASDSVRSQQVIEAADELDLDDYLARYSLDSGAKP